MRRAVRRLLSLSAVALTLVLWPASSASAHPLGNFTVNVYGGIHVVPGEVRVDYVVDMAEVPTFQELEAIDTDGDGIASASEQAGWARATAPRLLQSITVTVGGEPVPLVVRSASMAFRAGQGGLQTLRFESVFAGPIENDGRLEYRDGNFPGRIGWREVTAVGEDGVTLADSTVPVESASDALLSYPQDLLASPPDVSSMTASFHPGTSLGVAGSGIGDEPVASARPGVEGGALAGLLARQGAPLMLLAVGLALGVGAWHALLPGHGKTLMAAYMVGSGAHLRQAVAVGSAVAVMHTASVLALGLLVLTLERTFRPEALYPWLGLASGLVALGLGAHLMVSRLGAWGVRGPGAGHDHPRPHGSGHARGQPDRAPLSRKGLTDLALAGGILPAPSALLVMLAAINAQRVVFGLALVIAFSLGLATALIVIGVGALKARDAVSARLSSTVGRLVPVLSAGAIVAVGVFLTARGATQI
jgi:ABC-type nickel/cobalt efflux system permease component RcnA